MKTRIIAEFQKLINGISASRPSGWQFKVGMYRKAQKAFRNSNKNVTSYDDAKNVLYTVFKNPNSMIKKLKQLFDTGKIAQVEKMNANPVLSAIKVLSSVPYIGQVKAKKLVDEGILNVLQLKDAVKQNPGLLNEKQKLGLKYYNNLINSNTLNTKRIPRAEIDVFYKKVLSVSKKYNMTSEIAGSYRRKLQTSGDIDIIMTGPRNNMKDFINSMPELKTHFVSGDVKWMGIAIIDRLPRRVDIMYTTPDEYPFALMYFTGSQDFNEKFRGYARTLGYTLNEHTITHIDKRKICHTFSTENDIFEFLNVDYVAPEDRVTFVAPSRKKVSVSIKQNIYNVSKGVTLAETYDENKHNPIGMLMSEKYDGVRAIWDGQSLKTRTNKKIYAPSWFTDRLPRSIALDGELFTERGRFQDTISIIRKIVPVTSEWRKVTYKVFDSPTLNGEYMQRYAQLKDMEGIDLVKQTLVTSKQQMNIFYNSVLKKGGEGLMLRNPSMEYIPKRTKYLLKVKPLEDNEGTIINMIEGKGKDTGRMGALVVRMKENKDKTFKIGTGFTDSMRQRFWNNYDKYMHKDVTYSYKGLTNAGKPRHPVYMRMFHH